MDRWLGHRAANTPRGRITCNNLSRAEVGVRSTPELKIKNKKNKKQKLIFSQKTTENVTRLSIKSYQRIILGAENESLEQNNKIWRGKLLKINFNLMKF